MSLLELNALNMLNLKETAVDNEEKVNSIMESILDHPELIREALTYYFENTEIENG